jgi:hypothetical protein
MKEEFRTSFGQLATSLGHQKALELGNADVQIMITANPVRINDFVYSQCLIPNAFKNLARVTALFVNWRAAHGQLSTGYFALRSTIFTSTRRPSSLLDD